MRSIGSALVFVAAVAGCLASSGLQAPDPSAALGIFVGQSDIGTDLKPGKCLFNAGRYEVTGGGSNAHGSNTHGSNTPGLTDAFHFVYTRVSGDATVSADVHFANKSLEQRREAVLMFRQSLDPDSPFADIALRGDGSTLLQYRPGKGVATSEFRAAMRAPTHLSITRTGNEFSISANNGGEPAITGPIFVTMRDPVYLGLAVFSYDVQVTETATFSNLKLTKGSSR